jgi:hypothetical protein
MKSLVLSPHEVRSLSEIAFDKALHAAWAVSWSVYVSAGHADASESIADAATRASKAMEDAKAALADACPGLEIYA